MDQTSRLTERQRVLLDALRASQRRTGMTPTLRELGALTGVTVNAVRTGLIRLEKKGYLKILPRRARGIVVIDRAARAQ